MTRLITEKQQLELRWATCDFWKEYATGCFVEAVHPSIREDRLLETSGAFAVLSACMPTKLKSTSLWAFVVASLAGTGD